MKRRYLVAALLFAPVLLAACAPRWQVGQRTQAAPELRGLWVDAFGPGIKTPEETSQLVADAKAAGINSLFVQVVRRGDCYCYVADIPKTNDPAVPAGYDPLADVIAKAHAEGIQVHAWIITTAIWNSAVVQPPEGHVFHTHGLAATGREFWLMVKADGSLKAGADWLLDPGHPDAAEYIKNMYVSIVRSYDVDGVQFDRVRYPDYNLSSNNNEWGYNPTALARYRAETGAVGTPKADDPQWSEWRRQQITNLVRETALAVKAIRPNVSVNAATITYGEGPADEAAFRNTRTYKEVLQDWVTWTKEGYIDLNVMMNYKRDSVPAQAGWFDQWNAFAARLRQTSPSVAQVSGASIYLNDQASSVNQIRKTRQAGLSGWAGYSYRTPDVDVNAGKRTYTQVWPELKAKLTGPGGPFETRAQWQRTNARQLRAVRGGISVKSGELGGRTVILYDAAGTELAQTQTDGRGRYGFMQVPDGPALVKVEGKALPINALSGRVTDLEPITLD